MALTKRVKILVLLLLLLGAVGKGIFLQFRTEQRNRRVISLDERNSLIITRLSSRAKGSRTYIARSHLDKGILWIHPLEDYESDYLYEPRYSRDVMLKDGAVTFYSEKEELLYQFDYEDGSVLRTLQVPRMENTTLFWTALQDKDSLYLACGREEGDVGLKAVNFSNLSERWELDFGGMERITDFPILPLQNEDWIALHSDVNGSREVITIDKKSGTPRQFPVGETGFLREDFYYYLEAEGAERFFVRRNLRSGGREPLFIWEDSFPSPGDERYPSLWLYRDRLVHLSGDEGSSSVKIRNLENGELIREIPLPEGYLNIVPSMSQTGASAPEFTGLPAIEPPFLPLLLGETGPASFGIDQVRLKIAVIDLEKGRVHWESRPVYVSSTFTLFNINESNFYDDGIYGIYLPLPQRSETTYESLVLIDGVSGEITGCLRIKDEYGYVSDGSLSRMVRRKGDRRLFALSDTASLLPDLTLAGKDARQYELENLSGMMGEIYGF